MLWVVAGLAGLFTLAPDLDQAIAPTPVSTNGGGIVIDRAADGQFYAEAIADGRSLRLMIDPRSDQVLLSGGDAERLGLDADASFKPVTLPTLEVGAIKVEQVDAIIVPDLPVSLLGRSYLDRLSSASVDGDRMVLQ